MILYGIINNRKKSTKYKSVRKNCYDLYRQDKTKNTENSEIPRNFEILRQITEKRDGIG